MKAFLPYFLIFHLLSGTASAELQKPTRIVLRGLVCSFCTRELSTILSKQNAIGNFEIRLSKGDVLIWPKDESHAPTAAQLREWVDKAGLAIKEITFPN